jgi:tripartite-type tricarboxylate transporter receptor subunit TctC
MADMPDLNERHDLKAASSRRCFVQCAALLAAGIAAPGVLRIGAANAAFPDRPVKIVVANSPGGPSDIVARLLAATLQQAVGGSFVVENRGGGGGNIGMGSVARADPDGYTLLITTSVYAVNPGLYNSLPYDPFKDFVAIAELATTPNVFAVKPQLGVKTMRELVALAKANPDTFNVSTPPIGTTPYLAVELLKLREGLAGMPILVFAGGGEALQALLGNTVQLSVGTLAPAYPHLKAGTILALATTGATRWHDLPEVPTMAEAGFKDFLLETYVALMAPARTPPEIVAQLEHETLAILNRPDIRDRLVQSGFAVEAKPGKVHAERISREVPMFRELISKAGIKKL